MKKKTIGILFCVLLISSVFTLPIKVEANTVNEIKIESVDRDEESSEGMQISVIDNFLEKSNTKNKPINIYERGESEVLIEKITEEANIQEDGFLHLHITKEVKSSTLVKMYKECLGVPRNDRHVDMEIPEEVDRVIYIQLDRGKVDKITKKEPVIERFYQGVEDEQKHLFGFHITEFLSNRIFSTNPENELKIEIEANALPYFSNIEETDSNMKMTVKSAPPEYIDYFMDTQMDLINLIVQNVSGRQIFERSVDLTFNFPEPASILDVGNYQKSYLLGDSNLNMCVETISSKKVSYHEDWIYDEWESLELKEEIGKLFSIEYEMPSSILSEVFETFAYNFSTESLDGDRWDWSMNWDGIHLEGCQGSVCWDIDVDLYLTLSGSLHGSWEDQKIWTEFGVEAGFEVDATITGAWSHTFEIWDYMHFSTSCHDWRGTQPVTMMVDVEPDAELYVEVGGYAHIYINPEADFSLKAGGDVDLLPPGIHGIFEHTTGGSFDCEFDLDAYAKIKPTLGFEINFGLFGMGLDVTPQVYLLAEIGWDDDGAYWKAYLGCKVEIGIDIIITEWECDLPIDFKVGFWKGTWNPGDHTAPITYAYIGPGVDDHVGPVSYLWFTAIDTGPAASGVDYTMFRVPEAEPPYNEWQEFESGYLEVTTNIDEFHVEWYSVDKDGNEEDQHTDIVNADIVPPSGYLYFDGWNETVGENTFKVKPDTVIYFIAADDAGPLPSFSMVLLYFEHVDGWWASSFSETPEGYSWGYAPAGELFGVYGGEYTVEMYVIDKVWNGVLYHLTFIVDNQPPDKPDKPVGLPEGRVGKEYIYLSSTSDPDGNDIYYKFFWGDKKNSGWIGPRKSGNPGSANHSWDEAGLYFITVIAKDIYGAESEKSEEFKVIMPRNRARTNNLFINILQHLPKLYQILKHLLGG
ncbi:MAG: PKD domain-containing protein [Candidatus Hodarchaeota archaeon]